MNKHLEECTEGHTDLKISIIFITHTLSEITEVGKEMPKEKCSILPVYGCERRKGLTWKMTLKQSPKRRAGAPQEYRFGQDQQHGNP